MTRGKRWVVGLAGLLTLASGCWGNSATIQVAAKNDSNIKRVANLYSSYQFSNGWRGPKDENALKNYVEHGMPRQNVEMMGIDLDNLNAIFISERDGKPFKIRYGLTGGLYAIEAIVFEQEGVESMRLVAFNGAHVEEADEARYKALWEGRGGPPTGMQRPAERPGEPPSDEAASLNSATN